MSDNNSLLESQWWRLVRFGFRLLYNEMAFTYDTVAWIVSMGQWRAWQRTALDHLACEPGDRVLEIAHGTGNLQLDLYAQGYERVALDLSPYMGRLARSKLHRHYLEAPLLRARAQYLPFADQSFDAVVSTFPTPFIIESNTLNEIHRVLKPGKRLVVVMNGVLVGGGLVADTLETAYRVTGQRGIWPPFVATRFTDSGFSLQTISQRCTHSIAQLFIATRTVD